MTGEISAPNEPSERVGAGSHKHRRTFLLQPFHMSGPRNLPARGHEFVAVGEDQPVSVPLDLLANSLVLKDRAFDAHLPANTVVDRVLDNQERSIGDGNTLVRVVDLAAPETDCVCFWFSRFT